VRHWLRLPREAVVALFLVVFKPSWMDPEQPDLLGESPTHGREVGTG